MLYVALLLLKALFGSGPFPILRVDKNTHVKVSTVVTPGWSVNGGGGEGTLHTYVHRTCGAFIRQSHTESLGSPSPPLAHSIAFILRGLYPAVSLARTYEGLSHSQMGTKFAAHINEQCPFIG